MGAMSKAFELQVTKFRKVKSDFLALGVSCTETEENAPRGTCLWSSGSAVYCLGHNTWSVWSQASTSNSRVEFAHGWREASLLGRYQDTHATARQRADGRRPLRFRSVLPPASGFLQLTEEFNHSHSFMHTVNTKLSQTRTSHMSWSMVKTERHHSNSFKIWSHKHKHTHTILIRLIPPITITWRLKLLVVLYPAHKRQRWITMVLSVWKCFCVLVFVTLFSKFYYLLRTHCPLRVQSSAPQVQILSLGLGIKFWTKKLMKKYWSQWKIPVEIERHDICMCVFVCAHVFLLVCGHILTLYNVYEDMWFCGHLVHTMVKPPFVG